MRLSVLDSTGGKLEFALELLVILGSIVGDGMFSAKW
jgi:hypothetical protein